MKSTCSSTQRLSEAFMLNYKQSKQTSNHEYYEKFKDSVATTERLGSDIGLHASRIASIFLL